MLKVRLNRLGVRVRMGWQVDGSVFAGTIQARCTGEEIDVQIDADADPALVAALIQNARAGCFAEAALTQPVEVAAAAWLNSKPFDYTSFPKGPPRRGKPPIGTNPQA